MRTSEQGTMVALTDDSSGFSQQCDSSSQQELHASNMSQWRPENIVRLIARNPGL